MNKREKSRGWNLVKNVLRQRFGPLRDEDIRWAKGREEEFIHRIRELTGETKDAVIFALAAAVSVSAAQAPAICGEFVAIDRLGL
jgi:hypothetical protein